MALDDLGHNVEPHAQTGDAALLGSSQSIESLKDFLALLCWNTQAMIVHPDGDRLFGGVQVYLDQVEKGRI